MPDFGFVLQPWGPGGHILRPRAADSLGTDARKRGFASGCPPLFRNWIESKGGICSIMGKKNSFPVRRTVKKQVARGVAPAAGAQRGLARFRARVKADLAKCDRTRFMTEERDAAGNVLSRREQARRPGVEYLDYIAGIKDPDLVSTVLVEIPSYCDPELRNTIEAARAMAANPDRIRFAVCLQDDDPDILAYLEALPGCRVKHFAKKDAPGTCAARYECQQLYDGEDFVFHVDPHMRFARYWDAAVIDQWRLCGDPKAILSTWGVDLRKKDLDLPVDSDMFNALVPAEGVKIDGRMFADGPGVITGLYFVEGRWDPRFNYGNYFYDFKPRPGAFICAHYVFGPGRIDIDVPVDRNMDFTGDELAVAVRYYTSGYNIYHPGIACVYHLWRRDLVYGQDKLAPAGDKIRVDDGATRKQRQVRRVEKLLRLADRPGVDLAGFDLGTERTLEDYEEYSGLSFRDASITRFCHDGVFCGPHTDFEKSLYDWYPGVVRTRGERALGWASEMRASDAGTRERQRLAAVWAEAEAGGGCTGRVVGDLRVVSDGPDGVVLGWDGLEEAGCRYVVQGVADDLHFDALAESGGTSAVLGREACSRYVGFRVAAFAGDGTGRLLAVSGLLKYGVVPCDPIEVAFMPSYGGKTAVVLRHEGLYAYYFLFDRTGGGNEVVVSSEDFVFATDKLEAGHEYVAEGYVVRDGGYALAGCSGTVRYDGPVRVRPCLDGKAPVLSVVMPVRNVERYLPRAVDSVIGCDMDGVELVLVDDGSTDGSVAICGWYEERYDFVHVCHTDRVGPSSARNEGLRHASGGWVAFMDSDDMVHPYSYRKLYGAAMATGAGIAVMSAAIKDKFGGYQFVLNPFGKDSSDDMVVCGLREMFVDGGYGHYYWCSVANKIVRADIARKVACPDKSYFPNGITAYEDLGYTPALYSYAGKFVVVRGTYYIWEKRHKELLGAKSYYWGDTRLPGDSMDTYVYGLMYAVYNCDPEHRHEVDYRIMSYLMAKWQDYEKIESSGPQRALLARLVSEACAKYGFRSNPYIAGEPRLMGFLDELESYMAEPA